MHRTRSLNICHSQSTKFDIHFGPKMRKKMYFSEMCSNMAQNVSKDVWSPIPREMMYWTTGVVNGTQYFLVLFGFFLFDFSLLNIIFFLHLLFFLVIRFLRFVCVFCFLCVCVFVCWCVNVSLCVCFFFWLWYVSRWVLFSYFLFWYWNNFTAAVCLLFCF